MTMNNKDIAELFSKGTVSRVDLDPKLRPEITRQSLDNAVREIRKLIAAKRSVSVIIVKN
jgi:hypothetical protein